METTKTTAKKSTLLTIEATCLVDLDGKRARAAKKAAKTRAATKKLNDGIWKAYQEALNGTDRDRLKEYLGTHLWKRYEAECLEGALSGDKDFTKGGVLRKLLGSDGVKAMKADGLDINKLEL